MADAACGYVKRSVNAFFEYDTPKMVHIRSKSIGIFNRLAQLTILLYVIVWVFIYKKSYQLEDIGLSGTTTKVKGVTYTSEINGSSRVRDRVWDATDIVVPAEENNAFFLTTNVIVTNNQTPSTCPESKEVHDAHCQVDSDCPKNKPFLLGHGVATGKCNLPTNTCFVKAWCPIEDDHLPTSYPLLSGTEKFTVLIKNHVFFPFYKQTRSNIIESTNKTYLQSCKYHPDSNPFCPIFDIGYIVGTALDKLSDDANKTYDAIAYEGGVIYIKITWDCNFDYDPKLCKPKYDFDRLDKGEDSLVAKGYNYRYSHNYFVDGVEYRQQIKAYGILFIVAVDAKAGKFNVVPTFQNVGSGLALLALSVIVCDVFVLYLHKYKVMYRGYKYEQVNTDYVPMEE